MVRRTYTLNNGGKLILTFDKGIDLEHYKSFVYSLKQLIIRILNTEELIFHLRDIKIKFKSEEVSKAEKKFLISNQKQNIPDTIVTNGQIEFRFFILLEIRMLKGLTWFYKSLQRTLSHELVHCVHYEINTGLRKLIKIQPILSKKRELSFKQLRQFDTKIFLNIMDAFPYNIIKEGFARLFEKLKHDKLFFTKNSFNELYRDAMQSTELFMKIFNESKSIKSIGELHSFAKKYLITFFDEHDYKIGLHITYSLLYLRKGSLDVNMKEITDEFVSFLGKLRPKRLFLEYEILMKQNSLQPVMGYTSGAYLNFKEIQQQWR
ncbi:MAG: hypothetical protein QF864_12250, partial [SAR202 cluster bacterium]|nr:hypothetical protein [SAR202 cluster bacterium]